VRAVQLTRPGTLVSADVPEPDDATGVAIVALEQVGICGTDLKIYTGHIPVRYPRVLGHELVGHVVTAGRRGLLTPGARVLIDPAIACGHCHLCRADRANLCPNGALMGRDVDGGFAERIAVDELQLHSIPTRIGHRAAALLQVLGTCVHAQGQAAFGESDTAVVIGLGVAGLLHVQLLKLSGFRVVIGVGRSDEKRELALEFGASAVAEPAGAEAVIRRLTRGRGADVVIEAVGSLGVLTQAIKFTALGGTILAFGTITTSDSRRPFPWYELYHRELRIVNSRAAVARDYDRGIALAETGRLMLDRLFTRSFGIEDLPAAFDSILAERSRDLKIVVDISAGDP
jgi:L-iditol 2-dehydrogenase